MVGGVAAAIAVVDEGVLVELVTVGKSVAIGEGFLNHDISKVIRGV